MPEFNRILAMVKKAKDQQNNQLDCNNIELDLKDKDITKCTISMEAKNMHCKLQHIIRSKKMSIANCSISLEEAKMGITN